MGFFAEIRPDGVVRRVVVADDINWCYESLGGFWVECDDPYVAGNELAYVGPGVHKYMPTRSDKFAAVSFVSTPTSTAPSPIGGGSDDTAALQSWIDGMPNGSVGAFPPAAAYTVNGSLAIHTRSLLEFQGNGASFTATATGSASAMFLLINSTGISFADMTLVGENPSPGVNGAGAAGNEGRHGFSIRSSSHISIVNCDISGQYADPIYLGVSTTGAAWAEHIRVINTRLADNGRMGMGVVAARYVWVDGCTIENIRRSAIDLEPNAVSGGAHHFNIMRTTFGDHRLYTVASGGYGGSVKWVTMDDCHAGTAEDTATITFGVGPPEGGQRRGPFTVRNCSHTGAHSGSATVLTAPLRFRECDGVTVTGNNMPLWPSDLTALVKTTDCTKVHVANNVYTGGDAEWEDDGVIVQP